MENTEILDEFQHSNTGEESLMIDSEMQDNLATAAKWGKILAIIGFVMVGIGALFGLAAIASIGTMSALGGAEFGGMIVLMWVSMVIFFAMLALYILPLLFLNRFSSSMKASLEGNGTQSLAVAFENLGKLFKFLGIYTLVIIGVYFVLYIVMIAFSASMLNSLQAF